MRVLILGATGGTGREIVREAQLQGHSVTALVRSRTKAADLAGADLVEGDARDEQVLSRALEGCSGVISSLGTPREPVSAGNASVGCDTGAGKGDGKSERPPPGLHHRPGRWRQPRTRRRSFR
jgi:NAD(P)-dependent dehydrogenase (short-subunit alcohol dehydrogenase family)